MSGVPNLEAEILVSGVEELGGWQPWPVTLRGCPSQSGAVPLPSPPHDSASSLSQTSWGRGGALKRRRCSWRGRSRGLWPAGDVTPGWGPGRAGNLLPTQRPALQRQSCRDLHTSAYICIHLHMLISPVPTQLPSLCQACVAAPAQTGPTPGWEHSGPASCTEPWLGPDPGAVHTAHSLPTLDNHLLL